MPRYIERNLAETVIKKLVESNCTPFDKQEALDNLYSIPTADVQEVKHGRWSYESRMFLDTITDDGHIHRRISEPVYNQVRICSICGVIISNANEMLMFYCPHCGAKMDKKGGENNDRL